MISTRQILRIAFLSLTALGMGAIVASAQPDSQERREKIRAMKIGFITQKLNLTPEEAQKFFPVYNEYENKLEANRVETREARKRISTNVSNDMKDPAADNKNMESAMNRIMQLQMEELTLKETYYKKFKEILPIEKVAKLMEAESEFQRMIADELRKMREQQMMRDHQMQKENSPFPPR